MCPAVLWLAPAGRTIRTQPTDYQNTAYRVRCEGRGSVLYTFRTQEQHMGPALTLEATTLTT